MLGIAYDPFLGNEGAFHPDPLKFHFLGHG